MKRFLGLIFLLALVATGAVTGCAVVPVVPVPPDEATVEVVVPYDDLLGWWIEPHWVGGIFIEGCWTTDTIFVHEHWPWYHGHHRDHFLRFFDHHGWRGHHHDPVHHKPNKVYRPPKKPLPSQKGPEIMKQPTTPTTPPKSGPVKKIPPNPKEEKQHK